MLFMKKKIQNQEKYIPFLIELANLDIVNENKSLRKLANTTKVSLIESDLDSKPHSSSGIQKVENQILKMSRIMKLNLMFTNEQNKRAKQIENIRLEWKEAARRLENMFFIAALITIVIAPLVLFRKNIFSNDFGKVFENKCGCEYKSH